ncbi:hypothetical protein L3X38_027094 [Prunus dulcis]|uniref:Uncharacterized protein n=1 Tax=Prunus dulcis TaxID=3755 RepID=A0AAD4Z0U0_PRUDU|nr:hypothetical protein L3X38_027094 [Prunus dulcis]
MRRAPPEVKNIRRILLTSLNTNSTKRSFACTSQNCTRHKTLLRLHEPKLHKAQTLLRLLRQHEPKLHKAPKAPSPARAKTAQGTNSSWPA